MAIPFAFDEMSVYDEMPSFDGFSVYGAPSPTSDTSIYEAAPYSEDFAAMGLTPEQFADIQKSVANMDLSNIGLTGGLGLIGGYGPPGLDESKYMVSAPLSNKGNPTSTLRQSSNDFFVYDNQPVRLVDKATNQIVFEGKGPEDARKASELAAQLTAQGGRKASWDIQTGPGIDLSMYGAGQDTGWKTVANEKENKSTLGTIADIAGTALPIAVGFIPGLQGVGAVLASAGAGGVGAALRGEDILKGVAMGGLSAAGGQYLGDALKGAGMGLSTNAARAIGTGIGSTVGGVVTGQDLGNALLGGVASGGLSYLGGEAFGKRGGTTTSGGGDTGSYGGGGGGDLGDIVVTAGIPRFTGALFPTSFADKAQLNSNETDPYQTGDFAVKAPAVDDFGAPLEETIVTGTRTPATGSMAVNMGVGGPEVDQFGNPIEETIVTGQRETMPDTTSSTLSVFPSAVPTVDQFGNPIEETVVTGKRETMPDTTSSTLAVFPSATPTVDQFGNPIEETIVTGKRETPADLTSSTLAVMPSGTPTVDQFGNPIEETVVTGKRETPADLTSSTLAVMPSGTPTVDQFGNPIEETIVTGKRETPADLTSSTLAVMPSGTPTVDQFGNPIEETIVTGKRETPPDTTSSTLAVGGPDIPAGPTFDDEIVVTGKKAEEPTTGSSVLTVPGLTPLPKEIVDAAEKATDTNKDDGFGVKELLAILGLLGAAGGGGGGGTGTGTGTGGKFQDIFTKKLPTPGEGGALKVSGLKGPTKGPAGTYSARPVTDWYRFGMGPAMDIPAGADLSGATSPYAGYGPGTLGQETFKAVSGIPEQPTGMYAGGSMGYSRGSSRESFAVNGPGTGRSDDIPAVLSDGEYVIDAETVALLGDGSSKAGAKRLDELRVNIRKHKGRNLAKGKFSVNAKRPEKYLSGGRA